jgi:hypothetical protein
MVNQFVRILYSATNATTPAKIKLLCLEAGTINRIKLSFLIFGLVAAGVAVIGFLQKLKTACLLDHSISDIVLDHTDQHFHHQM